MPRTLTVDYGLRPDVLNSAQKLERARQELTETIHASNMRSLQNSPERYLSASKRSITDSGLKS